MTLNHALEALTLRRDATVQLAERLVRVNSHTQNTDGVNEVGQQLVDALAGLPLRFERRVGGARVGDHLCWSTPAAEHEAPTLLVGHHDTVFPPGTFEGYRVEDGCAFGPGTADMKSALAMCVHVLWALHDTGVLTRVPLRFISVADEETGSEDSSPWLRTLAKDARAGLVFEAGRGPDVVITARRGTGHGQMRVDGRAAHAGNALSDGRNAIERLSHFVIAAQALNDRLSGASVNVGLIRGGTSRNTVPAEARAELDLRFDDESARDALWQALQATAADLEGDGFRAQLTLYVSRPPLVPSDASRALCEQYIACQRAAGLEGCESPRVGGGSDANHLADVGVPTIDALGPRGRGFHTLEECVELESLPRKAEALLRFLWQCHCA